MPAWLWLPRFSPYDPVVVPLTGALMLPEPQPPPAGAAAAGREGAESVVAAGVVAAGAPRLTRVFVEAGVVPLSRVFVEASFVSVPRVVVGTDEAGALPSGVAGFSRETVMTCLAALADERHAATGTAPSTCARRPCR